MLRWLCEEVWRACTRVFIGKRDVILGSGFWNCSPPQCPRAIQYQLREVDLATTHDSDWKRCFYNIAFLDLHAIDPIHSQKGVLPMSRRNCRQRTLPPSCTVRFQLTGNRSLKLWKLISAILTATIGRCVLVCLTAIPFMCHAVGETLQLCRHQVGFSVINNNIDWFFSSSVLAKPTRNVNV